MEKVLESIKAMEEQLATNKPVELDDFDHETTMLIIIDMNNGFAKAGALYSNRVEAMIDDIGMIAKEALYRGMKVLAYTDHHPEDAKEFSAYPSHCVGDTEESELVDALIELEPLGLKTILKNSTNGLLAYNPAAEIEGIQNYVIVGCVTDICVYQFAVTLRAYLNENQLEGDVFVSMKQVQTFDIDGFHHGDLMHTVFLKSLMDNGVKIVENIQVS